MGLRKKTIHIPEHKSLLISSLANPANLPNEKQKIFIYCEENIRSYRDSSEIAIFEPIISRTGKSLACH